MVENKGFNENSWFDYFGHPHTDLMSVVERWTRPNKNTLHYEATVTIPAPTPGRSRWRGMFRGTPRRSCPNICQENNQYLNRLVDDFGQPIFGRVSSRVPGRVRRGDEVGDARDHANASARRDRLRAGADGAAARAVRPPAQGAGAVSGAEGQAESPASELRWDGKEITGVINPGPNAATVKSVVFDYTNPSAWGVKITAEGKDASGKVVPIAVDAKLENIGAYMRHLHGTWTRAPEGRVHRHLQLIDISPDSLSWLWGRSGIADGPCYDGQGEFP